MRKHETRAEGLFFGVGMALFFPAEHETTVDIQDGYIKISQESVEFPNAFVLLTEHQFVEMLNRSQHLLKELRGTQ